MEKRTRQLRLTIAVLAVSLGLAACSPAAEEQAASGQDEISVADTQRDAASGDPVAQYNLAQMYADGIGLPQDRAEAVKWWRKAAEQGFASAQYNLANSYANGEGVEQDLAEANKWYRKAADQGDPSAQHNLANSYANGRGVAKDRSEAAKWWLKAAVQGHAKAQHNLGFVYATGDGVTQDYVQAYKWLSLAATRASDGKIKQQAAGFVDEVAERMTSDQIAEAQTLAEAWKPSTP